MVNTLNIDDDESIFKKWNANINKNMEAGEFRKAMSIVDSFGIPQVVPSIDVFEKLQSKHPTKNQAEVLKMKMNGTTFSTMWQVQMKRLRFTGLKCKQLSMDSEKKLRVVLIN